MSVSQFAYKKHTTIFGNTRMKCFKESKSTACIANFLGPSKSTLSLEDVRNSEYVAVGPPKPSSIYDMGSIAKYYPKKNIEIVRKYVWILKHSSFKHFYDYPVKVMFPCTRVFPKEQTYTTMLLSVSLMRYLWEYTDTAEGIVSLYEAAKEINKQFRTPEEMADFAILAGPIYAGTWSGGHGVTSYNDNLGGILSDIKERIEKCNSGTKFFDARVYNNGYITKESSMQYFFFTSTYPYEGDCKDIQKVYDYMK